MAGQRDFDDTNKPTASDKVVGAAGKAVEKKIQKQAATRAVAGGTASAAGGAVAGVAGNIGEAVSAAKNKDVVGAADAAVRGAASGAANVLLTPAGGAAVSAAINSKAGRKVSKGVTRIIIASFIVAVLVPMTVVVTTIAAVMASASQVISNSGATETAVQGVYSEACSIVLPPFAEPSEIPEGTDPAEIVDDEDFITQEEADAINAELRSRTYLVADNLIISRSEMEDFQELNCVTAVGDLGISGYVIEGIDLDNVFTDGEVVFPNTDVAMRRALMFVGNAKLACSDGMCLSKCDHLAGKIWGYGNSGYLSAATHWAHAVANGYAKPGDTNPPLGALLYWDTGHKYGHVATYVGNGMVVSNLTTAPGISNVYLMPAAQWSKWHKYLGWSAPVFQGVPLSNAGFDR